MEPQSTCPHCGMVAPVHAQTCPFALKKIPPETMAAELVRLMKSLGIAWLVIGSVYVLCGSLCFVSGASTAGGNVHSLDRQIAELVMFGSAVTVAIGVAHVILGLWLRKQWRYSLHVGLLASLGIAAIFFLILLQFDQMDLIWRLFALGGVTVYLAVAVVAGIGLKRVL